MSTGPTDPMTLNKMYELLASRLNALEARQYDTAPSWATVILEEMREGFARVEKEISVLKREIRNIHGDFGALRAE